MWIRIGMAPLDPDLYWQYQSGSGSRTVKVVPKKEKNQRVQVKKSNDHFAEGLMVFTIGWESSINVFTAIFDWKKYFYFSKKNFLHFGHEKTWIRMRSWIRIWIHIDLTCLIRIRIEINADPKHCNQQ